MMNRSSSQTGFAVLGVVMVVATITLVGLVAFRFLDAQDNTEVATSQPTAKVATINTPADIDTATKQLDSSQLDSIDADLDAEFNF